MSFTTVTVTGTVKDANNVAQANVPVRFALTATLTNATSGEIMGTSPQTATTDATGVFSIALVATDDPTTYPKGQVYRCEIDLPSTGPVQASYFPSFWFALPASSAPTVNLAQLISQTAIPSYVGPTGPTGP